MRRSIQGTRRRRVVRVLSIGAACAWICVACSLPAPEASGPPDGFIEAEWRRIQELSPQPALPPSPTNAVADLPAAARLGQMLFFDRGFSTALRSPSDLGEVGQTGRVSCDSCHTAEQWFVDRRSVPPHGSRGTDAMRHRNAPTLVNLGYYEWFQWDGIFDSIWSQLNPTAEHPSILASNRARVVKRLAAEYRAEYEEVFGPMPDVSGFPDDAIPPYSVRAVVFKELEHVPAWQAMSEDDRRTLDTLYANYTKLLEAYVRTLVSGPSDFDRYVAGDRGAISASAKRGLRLFVGKAACHECHSGPMLSDATWDGSVWPESSGFHNLGIDQDPDHIETILDEDPGRGPLLPIMLSDRPNPLTVFNGASRHSDDPAHGAAKLATLRDEDPAAATGRFRTPSLRNVAMTAPYMHNGYLQTLEDVVVFYNQGGHTSGFLGTRDRLVFELDLTPDEIRDLVAFLETLTGDPVPARLRRPIARR